MKGRIAVLMSYEKDWMPVLIGSDLAIAEAAKEASPTGGVSSARMPKKKQKRCAAIRGTVKP